MSQFAAGIKSLAESQASGHKKEMKENRRRDEMFFQFQRVQRELDQQHESRMMQPIMTMQQQQKQLLISPPAHLTPQHRYDNASSTLPSRHFQNLLPKTTHITTYVHSVPTSSTTSDACIIATWIV